MPKSRLVINATGQQIRYALLVGQTLTALHIDSAENPAIDQNIYCGIVSHHIPGLHAVFVDIGLAQLGFLRLPSKQKVTQGQRIMVQVKKAQRESKGVELTLDIAISGHFLVLFLNNKPNKISRHIDDESTLLRLNTFLDDINLPHGVIIRSGAENASLQQLQQELTLLQNQLDQLQTQRLNKTALLLDANRIETRLIRDFNLASLDEIIVDHEGLKHEVETTLSQQSDTIAKITHHVAPIPLFTHYQIESQISVLLDNRVVLPSGVVIIFETTAALTAIDINSAGFAKQTQNDFALKINLEALHEIARQIQLRQLSGIIVIDFLKMPKPNQKQDFMRQLNATLKQDSAIQYISNLSYCGLIELNRRYQKRSLAEQTKHVCSCCQNGFHLSPSYLAYQAIREIIAYLQTYQVCELKLEATHEVIAFLQTQEPEPLQLIERTYHINLMLAVNNALTKNEYHIISLR